ncbi:MAG TPA: YciI family protein [Microlunatus sp.]|nr:YciI family protein [Microlunatus sp.]
MPNPDLPDAFDVYTVVVLRRPAEAPDLPEADLVALQAEHLSYRAGLARQGLLVANGPFGDQSDPSYRGLSIFACDPAEAARLSAGDPSVVAGRLVFDVMEWWVAAGTLAFPAAGGPVGDRRSLPGD